MSEVAAHDRQKVFDSFGQCITSDGGWSQDRGSIHILLLPGKEECRAMWVPHAEKIGLVLNESRSIRGARELEISPGVTLHRQSIYSLVTQGEFLDGLTRLISKIHDRHGQGRIWFAGEPHALVNRQDKDSGQIPLRSQGYWLSDLDLDHPERLEPGDPDRFIRTGKDINRRILIGCYYFHEGAR